MCVCILSNVLCLYHMLYVFVGILVTFIPVHLLCYCVLPRRILEYTDCVNCWNSISSVGSSVTWVWFLIFATNVQESLYYSNAIVVRICQFTWSSCMTIHPICILTSVFLRHPFGLCAVFIWCFLMFNDVTLMSMDYGYRYHSHVWCICSWRGFGVIDVGCISWSIRHFIGFMVSYVWSYGSSIS